NGMLRKRVVQQALWHIQRVIDPFEDFGLHVGPHADAAEPPAVDPFEPEILQNGNLMNDRRSDIRPLSRAIATHRGLEQIPVFTPEGLSFLRTNWHRPISS